MFLHTLRAHHDGPIGLVVHNDEALLARLDELAIDVMIVPRSRWNEPHIVVQRIAFAAAFIEQRPEWTHVFMCDSRDVAFQRSPFEDPLQGELEAHIEREVGVLSDHAATSKWIRRCFGADILERIHHRPALCAGTMLGTRKGMLQICAAMEFLMAIPRYSVGGSFGADQAAFNVAIHLGLIDADIAENYGRVATVGATAPQLTAAAGEPLARPDGFVPAVIHQYDRHQQILAHLEETSGTRFVDGGKQQTIGNRLKRLLTSVRYRLPELR
ncbi:hypothetical protein F1654_08210 [Alkalicaulis satelles]|uniref:Uncharacterized protein n=1 Tax=Alkalicaulis satelles TaxID=2609175 RepID=A0A5M6ZG90_9PROT|nr:hypothetical protein [Alkalicaulis satelles]KAA5803772.1 hypothetical protein F1654_08210 [Alkalicaulis satelles]